MSIDDMYDEDEDARADMEHVPFAAGQDILDQYGEAFSVALNEEQIPVVTSLRS